MAFENSETNDYVTEKFFQSLVAGSVPVVIGAPNVKFYAPDTGPYPYESSAVIVASDYGDKADIIAPLLLAFENDEKAYNGSLEWKTRGYSDDFKAMMDLNDVHSSCRACISIADERRKIYGPNAYDRRSMTMSENEGGFALYVRERGSYAMHRLEFDARPAFKHLVAAVLKSVTARAKNLWKHNDDKRGSLPVRVYAVYTPQSRLPVLGDFDVACLGDGAELEVIFV